MTDTPSRADIRARMATLSVAAEGLWRRIHCFRMMDLELRRQYPWRLPVALPPRERLVSDTAVSPQAYADAVDELVRAGMVVR